MSTIREDVTNNSEYWIKVNLAVDIHVKAALLYILYNQGDDPSYVGLPRNLALLHQHMLQFKRTREHALRHVLKPDHWRKLCPTNSQANPIDWDITLIIVVVINILSLPPPQGGWEQQKPRVGDTSLSAMVLICRWICNKIKHATVQEFQDLQQFQTMWSLIRLVLTNLNYQRLDEFEEIGSRSLKMYASETVRLLDQRHVLLENELRDLDMNDLTNMEEIGMRLESFDAALKTVGKYSRDKKKIAIEHADDVDEIGAQGEENVCCGRDYKEPVEHCIGDENDGDENSEFCRDKKTELCKKVYVDKNDGDKKVEWCEGYVDINDGDKKVDLSDDYVDINDGDNTKQENLHSAIDRLTKAIVESTKLLNKRMEAIEAELNKESEGMLL